MISKVKIKVQKILLELSVRLRFTLFMKNRNDDVKVSELSKYKR